MINSKREMRAPGDESAASSSSPKKRLNFFQFKNYTKKKLLFVCTIVIEKQHKIMQLLLHSEYISTLNYKS